MDLNLLGHATRLDMLHPKHFVKICCKLGNFTNLNLCRLIKLCFNVLINIWPVT